MREVFVLLAYLLMTLAKLCRSRGLYAVVAESLAVKHHLQVTNRSRRRAPRLTPWDRLAFGLCARCIPMKRRAKCVVILKPSSFTRFHQALALQIPMAVCLWKTQSPRSQRTFEGTDCRRC